MNASSHTNISASPDTSVRTIASVAHAYGDMVAKERLSTLGAIERLELVHAEDASTYSFVAALLEPKSLAEALYSLPQQWNSGRIELEPDRLLSELSALLATMLFNADELRQDAIVKAIVTNRPVGALMLALATLGVPFDEEPTVWMWEVDEADPDPNGWLGLRDVESYEAPEVPALLVRILRRCDELESVTEAIRALENTRGTLSPIVRGLREVYFSLAVSDATRDEPLFDPIF
ncbi:MAG: hypothetical protein KBD21_02965 [Candidatus Pacebacteria bacterium]|nr:hypothetical protein [Candidatus Paceibacterota bacterium]